VSRRPEAGLAVVDDAPVMLMISLLDKPFTDLYETEGNGGYPGGLQFKARPVIGGHFSFLALERACGGKAVQALEFLDKEPVAKINVKEALDADRAPFLAESKMGGDGGMEEL